MRRLKAGVAAVVALSIPVSAAWIGVAQMGSAGAASAIACKGLTGSVTGDITISKCTPSGGAGYKDGVANAESLVSGGGEITWFSSKATTTVKLGTPKTVTPNKCPKGATEYAVTGSVTAASTKGTGIPAVGDSVAGEACVDLSSDAMSIVKGTSFTL